MCDPVKDPTCLTGGDPNPLGGITNPFDWSEQLATKSMQSVADAIKLMIAGWTKIPSGALLSDNGAIGDLRLYTNWFVGVLAVGALIVAGGRLAREDKGQEAMSLLRRMGTWCWPPRRA